MSLVILETEVKIEVKKRLIKLSNEVIDNLDNDRD